MRRETSQIRPLEKLVRSIVNLAVSYRPGKCILEDQFITDLESLSGEELGRLSRIIDENRVVVPVYEALDAHESPAVSTLTGHLKPTMHRISELRRYRGRMLWKLAKVFDDYEIDYTVFKTLNRLGSVGVDIDVIIEPSSYETCVEAFLTNGFFPIDDLSKRYATGFMVKGNPIIVDLHTEMAILGVNYMSSDLLLGKRRTISFQISEYSEPFPLSVADEMVDAFVRIGHSVLKEGSLRIDDIAEASNILSEDPTLMLNYINEENLRLVFSVFSYIVFQTLGLEQFKSLIMFDENITHNLAKNILTNSITGRIPPFKLPFITSMLAFIDHLKNKGEIIMPMLRLLNNLRFRRNAAHLGLKMFGYLQS